MEIFFYQAECGDSARIRFYDNQNNPINILIDSGYGKTFNYIIKNEIEELIQNNEKLDLCIISHIHDDHIGGIIKYIKAIKRGELEDVVEKWLYNPPRNYDLENSSNEENLISSPISIRQGDSLFNYIKFKDKLLNYDISNELKQFNFRNLKMTILSPSKDKLKSLRKKYRFTHTILENIEGESVSEGASIKEFDYKNKIEDFNLDIWKEDKSIENGSSISVLTELKGIKVMWLADSHPTDIVESLSKLGYSKENKFRCDWVKVSHHGSAGNNNNELYDLIECKNYLISANGENKHFLPTKESIVRILLNENRTLEKKYTFYFTYDNSTLRKMFEVDGEKVFKKWNFEVKYLSRGKYLRVEL